MASEATDGQLPAPMAPRAAFVQADEYEIGWLEEGDLRGALRLAGVEVTAQQAAASVARLAADLGQEEDSFLSIDEFETIHGWHARLEPEPQLSEPEPELSELEPELGAAEAEGAAEDEDAFDTQEKELERVHSSRLAKLQERFPELDVDVLRKELQCHSWHVGRATKSLQVHDASASGDASVDVPTVPQDGWWVGRPGFQWTVKLSDANGQATGARPLGARTTGGWETATRRLALAKGLHDRLCRAGDADVCGILQQLDYDLVRRVAELVWHEVIFEHTDNGAVIGEFGRLGLSMGGTGCVKSSTDKPMRRWSGRHSMGIELLALKKLEGTRLLQQVQEPLYSTVFGVIVATSEHTYGWPDGWGVNSRNGMMISGGRPHAWGGQKQFAECHVETPEGQLPPAFAQAGDRIHLTVDMGSSTDRAGGLDFCRLSLEHNGKALGTVVEIPVEDVESGGGLCWAVQLAENPSTGICDAVMAV